MSSKELKSAGKVSASKQNKEDTQVFLFQQHSQTGSPSDKSSQKQQSGEEATNKNAELASTTNVSRQGLVDIADDPLMQEFHSDKEKLKYMTQFCNQQLQNFGMSRLGELSTLAPAEQLQTLDVVHQLLVTRQKDLQSKAQLIEQIARTDSENQSTSDRTELLQLDIAELKKQIGTLQIQNKKLADQSKEEKTKLLQEKESINKQFIQNQQLSVQYTHEIRKRDTEILKLKDQIKKGSAKTPLVSYKNAKETKEFKLTSKSLKTPSRSNSQQTEIEDFSQHSQSQIIQNNMFKTNQTLIEELQVWKQATQNIAELVNQMVNSIKQDFLVSQNEKIMSQQLAEKEFELIKEEMFQLPYEKVGQKLLDQIQENFLVAEYMLRQICLDQQNNALENELNQRSQNKQQLKQEIRQRAQQDTFQLFLNQIKINVKNQTSSPPKLGSANNKGDFTPQQKKLRINESFELSPRSDSFQKAMNMSLSPRDNVSPRDNISPRENLSAINDPLDLILDNNNNNKMLDQSQGDIVLLTELNGTTTVDLEKSQTRIATLQNENEMLQTKVQTLQAQLADLQALNQQLESHIQQLITLQDQSETTTKARQETLLSENTILTQKLVDLQRQLQEIEKINEAQSSSNQQKLQEKAQQVELLLQSERLLQQSLADKDKLNLDLKQQLQETVGRLEGESNQFQQKYKQETEDLRQKYEQSQVILQQERTESQFKIGQAETNWNQTLEELRHQLQEVMEQLEMNKQIALKTEQELKDGHRQQVESLLQSHQGELASAQLDYGEKEKKNQELEKNLRDQLEVLKIQNNELLKMQNNQEQVNAQNDELQKTQCQKELEKTQINNEQLMTLNKQLEDTISLERESAALKEKENKELEKSLRDQLELLKIQNVEMEKALKLERESAEQKEKQLTEFSQANQDLKDAVDKLNLKVAQLEARLTKLQNKNKSAMKSFDSIEDYGQSGNGTVNDIARNQHVNLQNSPSNDLESSPDSSQKKNPMAERDEMRENQCVKCTIF